MPCPLCGGLVHPVAGRCKHCKGDLTTFRAGRPQAAIPLPSLLANGNGSNGHSAAPAAVIMAREESAPILPPRQSATGMPAQRDHSPWRRWPVIVMVIAGLAIVGAVVVMFWLPPSTESDAHTLKPPPAPERMELNPIPPPNADPQPADPWGAPPHAQLQRPPTAPHMPAAPIDPVDPFADPGAAPLGNGNLDFLSQYGRHLCDRLAKCGNTSEAVTSYCHLMSALPGQNTAPTCPEAKRCLEHVDTMSCSVAADDNDALAQLMTQLPDCLDAVTRC
jgi:hypothetical protein